MQYLAFEQREKEYLKELGVAGLILFGSQAQGAASAASDFDFGVLVKKPSFLSDRETRNRIYDALYDLLSSKIKKLADIDIVFLEDAPMELRMHAAKHGKVLYEENPSVFADFRERTMELYADFAPLRRMFQEQTLARIL